MNSDIEQVAAEFVRFFEKLGIDYAMIGGFAVRVYALPRPTWDFDFVARIPEGKLSQLIQLAEQEGYQVDEVFKSGWKDQVQQMPTVKFKLFIETGKVDVDIFFSDTAFLEHLLQRRTKANAEGLDAYVISVEDLILMKLLANRRKDQADIEDILLIQGRLNEPYLRQWAERLNILPRLEEMLEVYKRLT